MTDRGRLAELIRDKTCGNNACMPFLDCEKCGNFPLSDKDVDRLADCILADGWMRPPVKVGSDIYTIQNGEVKKHFVMEVSKHVNGNSYIKYVPYDKNGIAELNWVQSRCTDKDIGRLIYLSREEALKALRKDEGK